MIERRARRLAVILEDDDVAEAAVAFEVLHAVAEGAQHLLHGRLPHRRERIDVAGGFDDHFVRADAVHPVEQALAAAIERALDAEHGKLIRDDAQVPAGTVGMSCRRGDATSSSRGVICSCPSQNGQPSSGVMATDSSWKSERRLLRSVEMMTQRPVTGSFLSSDTGCGVSSCYDDASKA